MCGDEPTMAMDAAVRVTIWGTMLVSRLKFGIDILDTQWNALAYNIFVKYTRRMRL